MRKLQIAFVYVMVFALSSCQKEISWENGTNNPNNPGGPTAGPLLMKIVQKDMAQDSVVETFSYNANKKLIGYTIKGENLTTEQDDKLEITRDANDRIISMKTIEGDLATGTYDTTTTDVYYTTATESTVAYTISTSANAGGDKDSIAFTYTNGKITKTKGYAYESASGTYEAYEESVYTYAASGNLINVKTYELLSSGVPELLVERKYEYDSKTAALSLGTEGIVTTLEQFSGTNNNTKIQIVAPALGGLGDLTIGRNYTYKSDNRPDKANVTVTLTMFPIPIPATASYYYQ